MNEQINERISNKGVCRTALTTPGLLIFIIYLAYFKLKIIELRYQSIKLSAKN